MAQTNQDIVGEKCIRTDGGEQAINEQDRKKAWKCYYEKSLNTEFPWDREYLEMAEAVAGPAIRIEKEMVREAVSKMKKAKAAGPSGVVAEMWHHTGKRTLTPIRYNGQKHFLPVNYVL